MTRPEKSQAGAAAVATRAADPQLEQRVVEARARAVRPPVARDTLVRVVIAAIFAVSAASFALLAHSDRQPNWWLYPAFVVAYAIACSIPFEVGSGEALPTELVLVPMLFLLPAPYVPLVVFAGLALTAANLSMRRRLSWRRAVFWVPVSSTFALGPAAVVWAAGEPQADGRGAIVLALAVCAQFALDGAVSCSVEWFCNRVPPRELARPLGWTFAFDALLAPLGYLAAIAGRVEPAAVFLSVPIVGLLALLSRERRERIDSVLELSSAYRGTAFLLGDVVEADDCYTGEHSRQVLELVLAVGDRIGLDARTRRLAEFTSLLHDVGKIRIPAAIIGKPGPLTAEERAIINVHTIEGERLLEQVGGLLGEVGVLVRSCHERWDGGGYPDGLAGEQIPLVARIVCCCDAFNAMTTDRPYRRALSREAALAELRANRGSQFDPRVVDLLLELAAEGGIPDVQSGVTRAVVVAA